MRIAIDETSSIVQLACYCSRWHWNMSPRAWDDNATFSGVQSCPFVSVNISQFVMALKRNTYVSKILLPESENKT